MFPLLNDPVRAVRIEAARVLARIPQGDLDNDLRTLLNNGIEEYIASQQSSAERPEAQVNLGNLYAARGQTDEANSAYRIAMELDPAFIPAYVNLANLYRMNHEDTAGERVLRKAISIAPDNAAVHHALGLLLVRTGQTDEALQELERATRLDTANARYIYVYAIALGSSDKVKQAILVLQGAHNQHPQNTDILSALVAYHRDLGHRKAAVEYAEKLNRLLQNQSR